MVKNNKMNKIDILNIQEYIQESVVFILKIA